MTVVVRHGLEAFFPYFVLTAPMTEHRGQAAYNGYYGRALGKSPLSFFFEGPMSVAIFFCTLHTRPEWASAGSKVRPRTHRQDTYSCSSPLVPP